jgi:hypothetical protein
MIYFYLSISISIIFLSFIVGMITNGVMKKTKFYNNHLINLNFVENDKLNKYIGVEVVKWIVRNTPFKYFNQFIKIKGKIEKAGLIKLREDMTNSEIGHLVGFVFVIIVALLIFIKTKFFLGMAIILTVNVLMNLYPSLLQQQNKRRIDKLIKKL